MDQFTNDMALFMSINPSLQLFLDDLDIKDMALFVSLQSRQLKPLQENEKEYKDIHGLLEPFLDHFKDQPKETVIHGFAILIGHLKDIRRQFDEMIESEKKKREGESEGDRARKLKDYLKNIQKIESALNCFKYGEYSRDLSPKDAEIVKNKLGFFPVDKLIIQGKQKDDKIEIEGNDALDIFRALLGAYYDAYLDEDDERIKQFSDDLFGSHSLFKANLVLATCPPGTYGSKFKKYNEKEKIEDKLQMQRQMLALNIHRFIKTYSTNGDKKISNWHKKLIGELLIFSGIAQNEKPNVAGYIEPPYYNNIANWIERG